MAESSNEHRPTSVIEEIRLLDRPSISEHGAGSIDLFALYGGGESEWRPVECALGWVSVADSFIVAVLAADVSRAYPTGELVQDALTYVRENSLDEGRLSLRPRALRALSIPGQGRVVPSIGIRLQFDQSFELEGAQRNTLFEQQAGVSQFVLRNHIETSDPGEGASGLAPIVELASEHSGNPEMVNAPAHQIFDYFFTLAGRQLLSIMEADGVSHFASRFYKDPDEHPLHARMDKPLSNIRAWVNVHNAAALLRGGEPPFRIVDDLDFARLSDRILEDFRTF